VDAIGARALLVGGLMLEALTIGGTTFAFMSTGRLVQNTYRRGRAYRQRRDRQGVPNACSLFGAGARHALYAPHATAPRRKAPD